MRGRNRQRRGRGRRPVRMLEPALLLLLHHGPAHGHTLLEKLGEFGLAHLHPSAVYRALRGMEEKDWVTPAWDAERAQRPPRRVYRRAALGDKVLGGGRGTCAGDALDDRYHPGHLHSTHRGGLG